MTDSEREAATTHYARDGSCPVCEETLASGTGSEREHIERCPLCGRSDVDPVLLRVLFYEYDRRWLRINSGRAEDFDALFVEFAARLSEVRP